MTTEQATRARTVTQKGAGGRKPPARRTAVARGDGRVEIPGIALPPRELCGNGRVSGVQKTRLRQQQRRQGYLMACHALSLHDGTPLPVPRFPLGTRVRLSAIVHRAAYWSARRLDDDNFWTGMKSARDALADVGLVANDSQFAIGDVEWRTAKPGLASVTLILEAT